MATLPTFDAIVSRSTRPRRSIDAVDTAPRFADTGQRASPAGPPTAGRHRPRPQPVRDSAGEVAGQDLRRLVGAARDARGPSGVGEADVDEYPVAGPAVDVHQIGRGEALNGSVGVRPSGWPPAVAQAVPSPRPRLTHPAERTQQPVRFAAREQPVGADERSRASALRIGTSRRMPTWSSSSCSTTPRNASAPRVSGRSRPTAPRGPRSGSAHSRRRADHGPAVAGRATCRADPWGRAAGPRLVRPLRGVPSRRRCAGGARRRRGAGGPGGRNRRSRRRRRRRARPTAAVRSGTPPRRAPGERRTPGRQPPRGSCPPRSRRLAGPPPRRPGRMAPVRPVPPVDVARGRLVAGGSGGDVPQPHEANETRGRERRVVLECPSRRQPRPSATTPSGGLSRPPPARGSAAARRGSVPRSCARGPVAKDAAVDGEDGALKCPVELPMPREDVRCRPRAARGRDGRPLFRPRQRLELGLAQMPAQVVLPLRRLGELAQRRSAQQLADGIGRRQKPGELGVRDGFGHGRGIPSGQLAVLPSGPRCPSRALGIRCPLARQHKATT